MFSFYQQPKSHGASTIVEFIEKAMEHSRNGKFLYFLRPRAPGHAPAPVQLLYPISRLRSMHSLQHVCRFRILRIVRRDFIDRLPIPPRLKEYLKQAQYYVEGGTSDEHQYFNQDWWIEVVLSIQVRAVCVIRQAPLRFWNGVRIWFVMCCCYSLACRCIVCNKARLLCKCCSVLCPANILMPRSMYHFLDWSVGFKSWYCRFYSITSGLWGALVLWSKKCLDYNVYTHILISIAEFYFDILW